MTFQRNEHAAEHVTDANADAHTTATITSISDARRGALVDEFVKCYYDAMVIDDALPESLERLVMGLR